MNEEQMFVAIVKAVDEGRITIDKLPGSDALKKKVTEFIELRDKEAKK